MQNIFRKKSKKKKKIVIKTNYLVYSHDVVNAK